MIVHPDFLSCIPVTLAPVPTALDDAAARGVLWQAVEGRFLLEVPGVARYLVKSGSFITVDPVPGASKELINYFLGMLPLAALVYQRGMLAFHAAAVTNGKGALLLAGDSGSGKSTLLAALLQRGWRMLTDDLAIVGVDEKGVPTIYPSQTVIALWPGTMQKLGLSPESFPFCDANRREYSLSEHTEISPQRLRGIYRLSVHSKPEVKLEEIVGSARFNITGTMLYNSHVADVLCSRIDYLRCAVALAQSVSYANLKRPRGVWSVDGLADHVEI